VAKRLNRTTNTNIYIEWKKDKNIQNQHHNIEYKTATTTCRPLMHAQTLHTYFMTMPITSRVGTYYDQCRP